MGTILFLWRTQLKNRILALKKNPGLLVLYIFLAALFIGFIIMSFSPVMQNNEVSFELSEKYFSGICAGLLIIFSYSMLFTGLNNGSAFFAVSDVHFLFPSPVPPSNILLYGIVKQMGMSLIGCIFIAFQGTNLNNMGIESKGLIWLYLGMFLATFISSLTASVIYSLTNSSKKKKFIAKMVLGGLLLVIFGFIFLEYSRIGNVLDSALNITNSQYFDFIPIFGWIKGLCTGIYSGNVLNSVIFGVVIIVFSVIMCLLIFRNDGDFYEDAISGAERKAELKAIRKDQGNNMQAFSLKKKTKIKEQGIKKGKAASTLFFRQMLEFKRKGMVFIDTTTLFVGGFAVFVALIIGAEEDMPSLFTLLLAFGIGGYMYLFFSMTGMWANEVKKPFIYLLPDSNFKKLFYATISSLIKSLVDGTVIFALIGIILELPVWEWLICAVAFSGFGLIYTAGDILCKRIFKRPIGNGFLRFVYFMILMVFLIPSVIVAVVFGIILASAELTLLCLIPFLIVNIGVYALILFLCRDLLSRMEFEG